LTELQLQSRTASDTMSPRHMMLS